MRRLVIALVILVALLVVADFAAAAIFEHEVAKRARAEFGLNDDPSVKVGGFSFLLQAFSGEYDQVHVEATGVPVKDLRDVTVKVDLKGVHAPLGDLLSGNVKEIRVNEADGQVEVKASDVNRAIAKNENELVKSISQVSISPVSEAQVADPKAKGPADGSTPPEGKSVPAKICATADIAGQSTNFCGYGHVELVNSNIRFAPSLLTYGNALSSGDLPAAIKQPLQGLMTFNLDPGNLPFKVTPTAVQVEPDGALSVKGVSRNVQLGGAG